MPIHVIVRVFDRKDGSAGIVSYRIVGYVTYYSLGCRLCIVWKGRGFVLGRWVCTRVGR